MKNLLSLLPLFVPCLFFANPTFSQSTTGPEMPAEISPDYRIETNPLYQAFNNSNGVLCKSHNFPTYSLKPRGMDSSGSYRVDLTFTLQEGETVDATTGLFAQNTPCHIYSTVPALSLVCYGKMGEQTVPWFFLVASKDFSEIGVSLVSVEAYAKTTSIQISPNGPRPSRCSGIE